MIEQVEPYEQTIFTLRMASLLPAEVVQALLQRFGTAFSQASEVQKLALVAAAVERSVTHARVRSMTDAHPRDVTVALSSLVQRGLLESAGAHKRTYYFLPGERPAAEATPVSFELPVAGLDRVRAPAGPPADDAAARLSPRQMRLLDTLKSDGACSLAELVDAVGGNVTERTVQRDLEGLRLQGLVTLTGRGRGARYSLGGPKE
jgi:predicted HTH transcriptional regulator